MKASKRTRMKGNCTLGVGGESAWRCKRGAAWGKQLRDKGFGAAGKSSCGARETSGEARKSLIAQKVGGTNSGRNESECDESGCAANGQKRQQKEEREKEKQLPGVQLVHRGGSMLGMEGVHGRRVEIKFAASSAGQGSSVSVRGSKCLRMENDGGGSQGFAKAEGGVIEVTFFQGGVGEMFATAKQGGLKNFVLEIGCVRGDRAMFVVELADEEYHVAKGICEVG